MAKQWSAARTADACLVADAIAAHSQLDDQSDRDEAGSTSLVLEYG
ncbi:MAG: hypothetical protein ACR2ND_04140 [Solirubrobacteraceae bacterium]